MGALSRIFSRNQETHIENFEKATGKILITGSIIGVFYLEKSEKKKGRGADN